MRAESNYWIGKIYLTNNNKAKACDYFYKAKSLGDKDPENSIKLHCK